MTTQSTTPPPTRAGPRFELTLAMLGAVSSALVTGVLNQLHVGSTGKLVGLALGAALPPFVAVAGRRRTVRVAAAVLLTSLALVLTYSGWQIFANVSGTRPVLPPPDRIVESLGGGGSGGGGGAGGGAAGGTTGASLQMTEGDLGISVSPGSIDCKAEGGCNAVTVTSTGAAALNITRLEFEGDGASYLTATGCEGALLHRGEKCSIALRFTPEKAPESASIHLVINQNFRGPATFVPLDVHGSMPSLPNLALAGATCTFSGTEPDPDTGIVSGTLTIDAPMTGTGSFTASSVTATVQINGDLQRTVEVNVDASEVHVSEAYEGASPSDIVVALDPDNQIQESSEDDNSAHCSAGASGPSTDPAGNSDPIPSSTGN